MTSGAYTRELHIAITAAREAGAAIRDLYERAAAQTYTKQDGSPVTDADLASDRIIRQRIGEAFPDDAILTEEGVDDTSRLSCRRLWVVDPIDGTRQFVNRTGEFDVLIALVVGDRPAIGVLLQPTTGLYLAAEAGQGALIGQGDRLDRLRLTPVAGGRAPRLVTSTWYGAPDTLPALSRVCHSLGSGEPLVNELGVYPRHFIGDGRMWDVMVGLPTRPDQTMAWEWDFAAADLVVNEAGGRFTDVRGNAFRYNKPVPRNEGGIVMARDARTHELVLAALAGEMVDG